MQQTWQVVQQPALLKHTHALEQGLQTEPWMAAARAEEKEKEQQQERWNDENSEPGIRQRLIRWVCWVPPSDAVARIGGNGFKA